MRRGNPCGCPITCGRFVSYHRLLFVPNFFPRRKWSPRMYPGQGQAPPLPNSGKLSCPQLTANSASYSAVNKDWDRFINLSQSHLISQPGSLLFHHAFLQFFEQRTRLSKFLIRFQLTALPYFDCAFGSAQRGGTVA